MIFKITLHAQRSNAAPLTLSREGDTLIINDQQVQFPPLDPGDMIPRDEVPIPAIATRITCDKDGVVCLSLIMPIGPRAPHESRFPEPITITEDGPASLPPYDIEPENEDEEADD